MFLSKNGTSKIEAFIGAETEIEGDIRTSASIRIDGKVKGSVHAGAVIIGSSGVIMGDVSGKKVTISGKVKGNVNAVTILELLSSGQVLGDLKTSKLTIADGATFEGNCQMVRSDGKVIDLKTEESSSDFNNQKQLKVISANGKR